MKKIKNYQLFVLFLIFGFAFYLPVVFAKAEGARQGNINNSQVNINGDQEDNNNDQEDVNDDQEDINDDQDEGKNDQEDINDDQEGNNNEEDEDDQFDGEEHKSIVATSVQSLLKVAEKEKGGIGDKIKEIAKEQNDNKDDVADQINRIKNRSGFKTFFIGTDYKNIGQLRSKMVRTSNQIDRLKELLGQTTKAESKTAIQAQIQILEQEQQKIGDLLKDNESKFSLFGWFVKLFY